jgi:hypothetical protein
MLPTTINVIEILTVLRARPALQLRPVLASHGAQAVRGVPHYLTRDGLDGGVCVRMASTERRAHAELIDELCRFARGEGHDEQRTPRLDSEAIDLGVASQKFAPRGPA